MDNLSCVGKCRNSKGKVTDYIIKDNKKVFKILEADQVKKILKQGLFNITNLELDKYDRITMKVNYSTI